MFWINCYVFIETSCLQIRRWAGQWSSSALLSWLEWVGDGGIIGESSAMLVTARYGRSKGDRKLGVGTAWVGWPAGIGWVQGIHNIWNEGDWSYCILLSMLLSGLHVECTAFPVVLLSQKVVHIYCLIQFDSRQNLILMQGIRLYFTNVYL